VSKIRLNGANPQSPPAIPLRSTIHATHSNSR
jgi:hypothetical protein